VKSSSLFLVIALVVGASSKSMQLSEAQLMAMIHNDSYIRKQYFTLTDANPEKAQLTPVIEVLRTTFYEASTQSFIDYQITAKRKKICYAVVEALPKKINRYMEKIYIDSGLKAVEKAGKELYKPAFKKKAKQNLLPKRQKNNDTEISLDDFVIIDSSVTQK